ncbi:phage major tail protein, TP901-1 family [Staphylococcus aureus]|nr:phage major tail protein, TP901-1 family [Staphylococcus aureus]
MYKDSKDRIYLFRKCGQKVDATKMMFMTEFENELENDFDIEDTMDGSYTSERSLENTLSATAKANYSDPLCDEFEDAVRDKIAYEVWEIESKVEGKNENSGKYKAKYHQGRFKKFKRKGENGSIEEYEVEFAVHDKYQRGFASIPREVSDKLAQVGYRFHNTTKDDFADDGLATKSIPQPISDEMPSSSSMSNIAVESH